MSTPHQVIGAKFAIDGISLLFAILRTLATRKRQGSRYTMAANICLFLTFAADLTATGIFIWIMIQEQKIIEKFNGDPLLVNQAVGNPDYTKIFFMAHFFYFLSLYFLKMAYLATYAQLFVRIETKKKIVLQAAAVITVLCFIAGILLQFFWCQPLSDNWNPFTTNKRCPTLFNHTAFATLAWINIATDLVIMAVPCLIIADLRLNRREKFGLIGIFIIGGSSMVASVIRYVIVGGKILNMEFNWNTLHIFALASHAEVLFGIIAFSLPAFRAHLRTTFGELTNKFTSQGSTQRSENHTTEMESRRGGVQKQEAFAKVSDCEWNDSNEALRK